MKSLSTECKETARDIFAVIKTIAPQLAEIAQKREFEITITNDKDGLNITCSMEMEKRTDDVAVYELVFFQDEAEMAKAEEVAIRKAMRIAKGNKKRAADILGISVKTLKRKLFLLNVVL